MSASGSSVLRDLRSAVAGLMGPGALAPGLFAALTMVWATPLLHAAYTLSVTDGLTLRVEADAGVQTSGASVTGWLDQSGQANHLTQPDTKRQPIYQASGFGTSSQPHIDFDGLTASNGDLLASTDADLNVTGNELTVFAVLRFDSITSPLNQGILGTYQSLTGYYLQKPANNRIIFYAGGPSGVQAGTAHAVSADQPVIIAGVRDATTISLYMDGILVGTKSISDPISSSTTTFALGNISGAGSGAEFFGGDFAAALIYDRTLSTDEREAVEFYLQRWTVPEPASALVLGSLGLMVLARRRRLE